MQRVSPRHSVGAVGGKKDIPFYFEMVFYSPACRLKLEIFLTCYLLLIKYAILE